MDTTKGGLEERGGAAGSPTQTPQDQLSRFWSRFHSTESNWCRTCCLWKVQHQVLIPFLIKPS